MDVGLLTLGDHIADPGTGRAVSAAERHRAIVESAVRAERAGFSSVWVGEHHFCDYIVSAPPVILAAIAERTESLRLGTGVTLLPHLDPVRAAEDYATVDVLSNGRVELVVGRGILAQTYARFGQDLEDSREIFAENLELLLALWREENLVWTGQHRAPLQGVTVHPRPVQQPNPPVWVGGGSSAASVDLAARLGLPLMLPSVVAAPEVFAPLVERYREGYTRAGHDPAGMRVGACSHVHVAETSEQARSEWRPHYEAYWAFIAGLIQEHGAAAGKGGSAPYEIDFDTMLAGPAICGSPEAVSERMLKIRDHLGLDLHLAMVDLGGLPEQQVYDCIDLLGEGVIPHLR